MSKLEDKIACDLNEFAPPMSLEEFGKLKKSEVLELALRDLEAIEKIPRFKINMRYWHHTREDIPVTGVHYNGRLTYGEETASLVNKEVDCIMCAAGTVMHRTLRLSETEWLTQKFGESDSPMYVLPGADPQPAWSKNLAFISDVACGAVYGENLHTQRPSYGLNPEGCKAFIRSYISKLKARGE